jgi:hypothetical protein
MKALVIGQNEYGVVKNSDDNYDTLVTYDLKTCCAVLVKTESGDIHLAHIDISSSPSSIERLLIEPFVQQKSNVENVTLIGNFAYFKDSSISNPQKLERMHNFNNINTCFKNAGLKPQVFQSQSGAVIISKNGEIENVGCSRSSPELIELTTSNGPIAIEHDQVINAIANANAISVTYSENPQFLDLFVRYDGELKTHNPDLHYNAVALVRNSKEMGIKNKDTITQELWKEFGQTFGDNIWVYANALAQILDFDERQQAKTSLGHVARLEESSNECSTGCSR